MDPQAFGAVGDEPEPEESGPRGSWAQGGDEPEPGDSRPRGSWAQSAVVPETEESAPRSAWAGAAMVPEPEGPRRRSRSRAGVAGLVVLAALAAFGLGLAISGGSAAADAGAKPGSGDAPGDVAARSAWRSAPADAILPPKLSREGSENYYRLAVDTDESCTGLPAAFRAQLGRAGCVRLIQATYVDSTESVVATVGLVVAGGSAADRAALFQDWTADSFAKQYAMMPATFPVRASLAAAFQNPQRVAWMSGISDDGTYIAFTVAGFVDGRAGSSAAALAAGTASDLQSASPAVQVADDLPTAVLDALGAQTKTLSGGAS